MTKQPILDHFNISPTIFDRARVILSNFFMGKSRCIPGSPGDYFHLLVKQEFQATCKIIALRPRISLENGRKVSHSGRLLIKWVVTKVSAIFRRSRDLLEVLRIWRSLDKKQKTTNREDTIMVRKACPIPLMVRVSLLPLPDEKWERMVPTATNQVTICTTSE